MGTPALSCSRPVQGSNAEMSAIITPMTQALSSHVSHCSPKEGLHRTPMVLVPPSQASSLRNREM